MRHFVVCLGYHGAGVQSSFGSVLLTFCIREKGSVVRIRTYDVVVEFYSAVSILFVLIVYFIFFAFLCNLLLLEIANLYINIYK